MSGIDAITLGSWPDWLAAVGTSAAFLIAARSYRIDVRRRKEAQARLVYGQVTHVEHYGAGERFPMLARGARAGFGDAAVGFVDFDPVAGSAYVAAEPLAALTVAVHNGSEELISRVRVQVHTFENGQVLAFNALIGPIEPRAEAVVEMLCRNDVYPARRSHGVIVTFEDSSGQWWKRCNAQRVKAVPFDPAFVARTPEQIHGARALAESFGETLPPYVPPRLPLGVRFRRAMRGLRGLPPVP